MNIDELNQTLLEIWAKAAPGSLNSRLPLFRSPLKPNCLLFVGINPSFSESGFNTFLTEKEQNDVPEFYKFPPTGPIDMERHLAREKQAMEKYAYFARFREMARDLALEWDHLDLLSIRETNQAEVRKAISDKKRRLLPFAESQLEVSIKILRQSQPTVIVVANAFASRLFHERFDPTFDDDVGCHRVILGNRSVPVFLTSMLTGQRALDTFSYKRLIWHVSFVIGQISRSGVCQSG